VFGSRSFLPERTSRLAATCDQMCFAFRQHVAVDSGNAFCFVLWHPAHGSPAGEGPARQAGPTLYLTCPIMPTSEPIARLLSPEQIDPELKKRAERRDGFSEEYPFVSRWFEVDGHVQHYIDEGQGTVLLMVHGNPTWSFAWRRLVKDLCRDHRVIAIDHLGCGFSEKPQDRNVYTLNQHIQRLAYRSSSFWICNRSLSLATIGAARSAWAAPVAWRIGFSDSS
jgi:hypothetical protein